MNFAGLITMFGSDEKQDIVPDAYAEFLPAMDKKTQADYPYSYDPFLIYFNENAKEEATSTIYSDRLTMWNWDKHNRLCEKHFGNKGQLWNYRDPKKIEAFLCDWTEKKVVLVANIQYVHLGNGYPLWRFDFYEEK